MKIKVFSTHDLFDNRIKRHLTTLINNHYHVEYVNSSISDVKEFECGASIKLHYINEPFIKSNLRGVIKALCLMCMNIFKNNADVVHVHDPLLIPLLLFAKLRRMKTVYDKHESYEVIPDLNSRVSTVFEKIFIHCIDGVIYVNEQQRSYLDKLGYRHKRMIPNYQSAATYNIDKSRTVDDYIYVTYIGSLQEEDRNINLMLDVMHAVMKKCANVKFILGGSTTDETVNRKIVNLSKLFDRFMYKGFVKYSEVVSITVNSDIGIYFAKDLPNNKLSSPNKIYEYMIAGVALVGMGTFTHADEIDGYAGKIFNFNAVQEDIVSYIATLANDTKCLVRLKENAKVIGNKYTWESVDGRYKEMYEVLMSMKKPLESQSK